MCFVDIKCITMSLEYCYNKQYCCNTCLSQMIAHFILTMWFSIKQMHVCDFSYAYGTCIHGTHACFTTEMHVVTLLSHLTFFSCCLFAAFMCMNILS